MDVAMQLVRERADTGRAVVRSAEFPVREHGGVNYHCAECGTLLVRETVLVLPDVIVICPVCLSLNEAASSHLPMRPRRRGLSSLRCGPVARPFRSTVGSA